MIAFLLLLMVADDPPRPVDPQYSESIVVTAERLEQPATESTAAVTVLTREQLEALPAQTLGDALRLVPGLQLIAVNPGAPPMVSSRGFFGAGEVEYVQLRIDGVTAGDVESGLADWRAIPVESIERVEVLRGAGSSLYGDTALGGVVQVFRRPQSHASLSFGSFGTTRVSGAYADDALTAGGSFTRSDGFREHSASRELFANAAFTRGAWRASIDASDRDRDDPGPLGAEDLYRFDREDTRRLRGAVGYRTDTVDVVLHAHERDSEQVRTFLLAPGFGDRALRDVGTFSTGLTAMRTTRMGEGRVAGGVELAHASLDSRYFAFEETRGGRLASGDGSRRGSAAFVTGEWPLTPRLRLAAGARYDRIDDAFEDVEARDHAFSPRIALSVDAAGVTSYLQLARAFKAPTLDQRFDQRPFPDFAGGTFTISNPALDPQRSTNVEAGIRGRSWEVIAYQIDVEDEIDLDLRTFRYANIGRTRHRGVEASLQRGPAQASYTWTRVQPRDGDERGTQLKNIAEHVLRAGFNVDAFVDVYVGAEHSAGRYLDDANVFALDDATVVDLRLSRRSGALGASLEASNVFDRHYEPLGFELAGVPFHYPAAGRVITLTVSWKGVQP